MDISEGSRHLGAKEAQITVGPDKKRRKRFKLEFGATLQSAIAHNCSFFDHLQRGMSLNDTRVLMLGKSIANLAFFNARITHFIQIPWQELIKQAIKSICCTDNILLLVFNTDKSAASSDLVHISFLLHRAHYDTHMEFRRLFLEPLVGCSKAREVCWNAILSSNEVNEIAAEPKFKHKHALRNFGINFGADENNKNRADKPAGMGSLVRLLQDIQKLYTPGEFEFFLYASLGLQERYSSSTALGQLNCGDHNFWKSFVNAPELPTLPACLLLPVQTMISETIAVPLHHVSSVDSISPVFIASFVPAVPESDVAAAFYVPVSGVPVSGVTLAAIVQESGTCTTFPVSDTTLSMKTPVDNIVADKLAVDEFVSNILRHERAQPNGAAYRTSRPVKMSLTLKGVISELLQMFSLNFDVNDSQSHLDILHSNFEVFSSSMAYLAFINKWEHKVSTSEKGIRAVTNVSEMQASIAYNQDSNGISTKSTEVGHKNGFNTSDLPDNSIAIHSQSNSEDEFSNTSNLPDISIAIHSQSNSEDDVEDNVTKVFHEQQPKAEQLSLDRRQQNYNSCCLLVGMHFFGNNNAVFSDGWGLPSTQSFIFVLPQDRPLDGFLKQCGQLHCIFLLEKESGIFSLTADVCRCEFYTAQSRIFSKDGRSFCIHQKYIISAFEKEGFLPASGSKQIKFPMPSAGSDVASSSLSLVQKVFSFISQNIPHVGTGGSVVGPLFFPKHPKIVEYSLIMPSFLAANCFDTIFIRLSYDANVQSCYITCSLGTCKHYVADKNCNPLAEIDGDKDDSFCSHLRFFRNEVGVDNIKICLKGLFDRNEAEKKKEKTGQESVFDPATGTFTYDSLTGTTMRQQNARGVDFEAFMGHAAPLKHELMRLDQLDWTLAQAPLDQKFFGFKIARDAVPVEGHILFQLIPSSHGSCYCAERNAWDPTPVPTGKTTRLYTESSVGIFDLFILKPILAGNNSNCCCKQTYCGVEDGIHMHTDQTAFTITLLKSFTVNTMSFGIEMDFSAFCSARTFIYQQRHGSGMRFADENTFLDAWFSLVSTMGILSESGFQLLNFRNPCPECTNNGGVQTAVALDGTTMIQLDKRNRPLGCGHGLPEPSAPRTSISCRWTRATFYKDPKSKISAEFHTLISAAQDVIKSVKDGHILSITTKGRPNSTASLFATFKALYEITPLALPKEFLSVLKLLTSDALSISQRCVVAKFLHESTLWQCVTLWLPVDAVPALLSLVNIAADDSLITIDDNLQAEINKHFILLDTKSSLFALLLQQFCRKIPSELRVFLLYICERSKTVYTLLSGDVCPKAKVREGSYDPIKNMEALFFTAGPNTGDKLHIKRETTEVVVKMKNVVLCDKGHSLYNTIFSFLFFSFHLILFSRLCKQEEESLSFVRCLPISLLGQRLFFAS